MLIAVKWKMCNRQVGRIQGIRNSEILFDMLKSVEFFAFPLVVTYLKCLICKYVYSVPEMCPSLLVTSHSACWRQSQTSGQATTTFTTTQLYRRWYMPARSGSMWVDSTTPENLQSTSDTDTTPSRRSPSVAGEKQRIGISNCSVTEP